MGARQKHLVELAEVRGREWAEREVARLLGPPSLWPREWDCPAWLAVDQVHDLARGASSCVSLAAAAQRGAARRYAELRRCASQAEPAGGDIDRGAFVRALLVAAAEDTLSDLQRHQARDHLLPWEGTPLWTDDPDGRGALWAAADQTFIARAVLCDWRRHHACAAVDVDGREYVVSYFDHFDLDAAVDPADLPPSRARAVELAEARGEGWADWAFFRRCERDDPDACQGRWPPSTAVASALVADLARFAPAATLARACIAAADRRWCDIERGADLLTSVEAPAASSLRH